MISLIVTGCIPRGQVTLHQFPEPRQLIPRDTHHLQNQSTAHAETLLVGLPLVYQLLIGAAFTLVYWMASRWGSRLIAKRKAAQHIAESYSRLDLSGWNPLWIALAAGIGEELFFRGALQPIVGLWVASLLFVLVHVRAYRWNQLNKRVLLQSVSILAIGLSLGLVAMVVGLLAAIIVHAAMDAVGLYAIRRMTVVPATAAE